MIRSDRVLKGLPELYQMDRWLEQDNLPAKVHTLAAVETGKDCLPLYCFELGNPDPATPTVIFSGGVHGVERIGTQVILAYMNTLFNRLDWDESLDSLLQRVRILFVPLINPVGMLKRRRSNINGVDLMRNAPIDATGKVPLFLGGHRISRHLPWYRGKRDEPPESEFCAIQRLVESVVAEAQFTISLDCHSGFGHRDQVWFPYAYTPDPFDDIGEMFALRMLFRRTHPSYSFYLIEPQSRNYTTHGDMWDYLYRNTLARRKGVYLPLTLEMGSWLWVKKNPLQLFNALGVFNPVLPHRHERVLRRHQCLMEFLLRASANFSNWLPGHSDRREWMHQAIDYWY
ncbi:DUF2817 domain-containing protein [Ketobacter sp.]